MKKFVYLLLAAILVMGFTACSGPQSADSDEPADAEPIVIPDTGGNTILDTKNVSDNGVSMVLPIVGTAVLAVIIVVTIITAAIRRRKVNKFSVHTSRHLVAKVASLSIVLLLGLFAIANLNGDSGSVSALLFGGDSNTKASIHDSVNALSITTNDIVIDLDLEDDKVFGVGESVVSVDTATTAGYTLMAYVDSNSTDLKNETNTSSSSTISMLETTYSQALIDNTWGMAINEPSSEEDVLFRGLPTTEKEIMTLKATSEATAAGDESTFYYGAYITPDLDYGTYGGVTINYVALANVDSDVVTVQYHTGYGSNERINTVVYGAKPRVAYYYDGCSTEYLGETQIVKSYNIDDDGTMLEEMAYDDEFRYIRFEDADYLKVELTYGIENDAKLFVYKSDEENRGAYFGYFTKNQDWIEYGATTTISFDSDSNTIGFYTTMEYISNNYGYYARITPVYAARPTSGEVTEYENCYIKKSDNVDNAGNKVRNFESDAQYVRESILAPGAERMIVNVKYGFADYAPYFGISNGIRYNAEDRKADFYHAEKISSSDDTYYLGGNSVVVGFELYDDLTSQSGAYGYYVRGYPVFYEERESTVPIVVYDAYRKSGTYVSPEMNDWQYHCKDDFYCRDKMLEEASVIDYIGNNFEALRGRTIDLGEIIYMQ